jgi:hypothetical protein
MLLNFGVSRSLTVNTQHFCMHSGNHSFYGIAFLKNRCLRNKKNYLKKRDKHFLVYGYSFVPFKRTFLLTNSHLPSYSVLPPQRTIHRYARAAMARQPPTTMRNNTAARLGSWTPSSRSRRGQGRASLSARRLASPAASTSSSGRR